MRTRACAHARPRGFTYDYVTAPRAAARRKGEAGRSRDDPGVARCRPPSEGLPSLDTGLGLAGGLCCKMWQTLGRQIKKVKKKYNRYAVKGEKTESDKIKFIKGRKTVKEKNKDKERGRKTENRSGRHGSSCIGRPGDAVGAGGPAGATRAGAPATRAQEAPGPRVPGAFGSLGPGHVMRLVTGLRLLPWVTVSLRMETARECQDRLS